MRTIMIILDHTGQISIGRIITKSPEEADKHFINRICGGRISAEPVRHWDAEEMRQWCLDKLNNAAPDGFIVRHVADQGEHGNEFGTPWKLYALFADQNSPNTLGQ